MIDLTDEEKRAFDKIKKRFGLRFDVTNIRRVPKSKRPRGTPKQWTDDNLRLLWLQLERQKLIHKTHYIPWSKIKLPLVLDVYGSKGDPDAPYDLTVPSPDEKRKRLRNSTDRSHRGTLKRLYRMAAKRMKEDATLAKAWKRDLEDAKRWASLVVKVKKRPGK